MSYQGRLLRPVLQGALIGLIQRHIRIDDFPLKVGKIEVETDEEGVYKPYFTVVTFSGVRLKVTVEEIEKEQQKRETSDNTTGDSGGSSGQDR
jgi:hypothetical protein